MNLIEEMVNVFLSYISTKSGVKPKSVHYFIDIMKGYFPSWFQSSNLIIL